MCLIKIWILISIECDFLFKNKSVLFKEFFLLLILLLFNLKGFTLKLSKIKK